jgi:hypothetical protein
MGLAVDQAASVALVTHIAAKDVYQIAMPQHNVARTQNLKGKHVL